jgi:small-conductance mechanosensitive channel
MKRRGVPVTLLLLALACAAFTPAAGQEADSTAPVVVDGDTLFMVRGVSAFPAERRAAAIAGRIRDFASDRSLPVDSLRVEDSPIGTKVVAAGRTVFGLVDADAELEGVSRQVLAEIYRLRTADAVRRYRADRDPGMLWGAVARALVATLGLVLGLMLATKIMRRLRGAVERRFRDRMPDLGVGSVSVIRGEQLWHGLNGTLRLLSVLVVLLAIYSYFNYVLVLFPWTRGLGHNLSAMLLRPLATLAAGAIGYLPNVIFLIVLALFTKWTLRLARLFFRRVADGSVTLAGFDPDWALPTDRIVRFLVIAFALVIAYPYIPGSGSEAFKGITLLTGLIFSLGSPSVIGNLVAGQSLAFRRAFKVGDRVKIGEHIGEVLQIRLLTTYLRSPKNEQIVIPNSTILNSEVVNFTALAGSRGLILHSIVGIGYETPWRQVEAMLIEAAGRTPGLLREPPPFVLQRTLNTFAVDYEINVYTDAPDRMLPLYSALHSNILDVFNEYGVQIMTPAYEGDPETPKVVAREEFFAAPAAQPAKANGDGAAAPASGSR